jgi:hypothetical protein
VSADTVDRLRADASLPNSDSDTRAYITKHGTASTMRVTNIGRRRPAEEDEGDWSDREMPAPAASAPIWRS